MFADGRKLSRQLRTFPANAAQAIKPAMEKNGAEGARYMKALVPVGTRDAIRTRDTIGYAVQNFGTSINLTIIAGDGTQGAPARLIEFANDQPFFYPVIRIYSKRWRNRMKRAINKAAKDQANGS